MSIPDRAVIPQGERLVTSLFADVRGYAALGASLPPKALAERMAMLYRLARVAVEGRTKNGCGDPSRCTPWTMEVLGRILLLPPRRKQSSLPATLC